MAKIQLVSAGALLFFQHDGGGGGGGGRGCGGREGAGIFGQFGISYIVKSEPMR